ncbi:MAG: hypothetical protein HGA97_10435 [Chlorobiaceae bacterium]|nr:hypothetical protein [Chlorobiaceae bacterium]
MARPVIDRVSVFFKDEPGIFSGKAVTEFVQGEENVVAVGRSDEHIIFASLAGIGHNDLC